MRTGLGRANERITGGIGHCPRARDAHLARQDSFSCAACSMTPPAAGAFCVNGVELKAIDPPATIRARVVHFSHNREAANSTALLSAND